MLVGTWLTVAACSSTPRSSAPAQLADRFALEEGERLYQKHCAPCHGPQARGDGRFFASDLSPAPTDLASAEFARSRSDADLVRTISQGSAAVGKSNLCPAWGQTFSPTEIEYIVAFIRSLQRQVTAESAP